MGDSDSPVRSIVGGARAMQQDVGPLMIAERIDRFVMPDGLEPAPGNR
jgi:hypothetical protein